MPDAVGGISSQEKMMLNNPLPRIDSSPDIRDKLLPHCRLKLGQIWTDPLMGHRVGCLDASDPEHVREIMSKDTAQLAIHDPPYNVAVFGRMPLADYVQWCQSWVSNTLAVLNDDSSLYVWLGADQNDGFKPLPDFIVMMRNQPLSPRSIITMRNQRGYGTQKNWMAVRQELLYYTRGKPKFHVDAEYTDIPKILRGYYKKVNGQVTDNLQRGRGSTIRAGNVWVDIQQVFYRMEENVSGCYAQKPLKCIERIIRASSSPNNLVIDYFAHSGTTLIASEKLQRKCYTLDIDPIYAEITIRRLERLRTTGKTGWQNGNPFENDVVDLKQLPDAASGVNAQAALF
ncbi:MAG: site-specific DNA-methyltransferase [Gammaproteobacteria bacterium]|nr:site-specific DNA-methyltransferase [Gammaproteobacteria bacterium]MCY4341373.1 site-specific DNA-methyltransferase [Gammaproteobacteria bacterium]